jgi:transcriptional regulator with XRE-family HTH domain
MYAINDGGKIARMREARGLSRRAFAAEAGVAPSTIARVESGERVLASTSWRVAGVFHCHPRELGRPAPTSPRLRELMELDEA